MGWNSIAALPLTCAGKPIGVFFLYSRTRHAFDSQAQRLLVEMAMDMSYGLTKLALRETQLAERVQLQKLSRVVNQSESMVAITDADFHITYVNPELERVTGYTRQDVMGRPLQMLLSSNMQEVIRDDMFNRVRQGERWHGEVLNAKKDGTDFPCNVRMSPLFADDGKILSYVKVAQDLTRQRKLDATVEQLTNFDALTGLPN